jgi:Ca2+-binding RTX toxin-like protein
MPNFVGGTGNDTFTLNAGQGASTLIDAGGTDMVMFGPGINTSMVTYGRAGNDLIIKYGTTDSLRIVEHFATDASGNAAASRVETLKYTGGFTVNLSTVNLKYAGGTGADTLLGWTGNDQIGGDAGNDTLSGFDGNDILSSAGNDDVVYGGNGQDLIYGGGGIDLLNGDAGNDTIFGDGGNDTINGGDGNDTIDGGINNDIMSGGAGNDLYTVDNAADQVIELAGEGVDTVQAGFNYTLTANVENLTLTSAADISGTGNAGDNVITGNVGNNVLNGVSGADTLSGGAGNDTLVFTAGAGSSGVFTGNAGTDALALNLTAAQVTPALRADMQGFADWMAANLAAVGGDAAALAAQANGATFTFASLNLTVSSIEGISITVDGQAVPLADFLNKAPTITTTAIEGTEDQVITGTIQATDLEGDAITFAVTTGPQQGVLTVDPATGAYTYQAPANWSGTDQFTVTANDGRGGIATQTIAVGIGAVADAPSVAVSATNVIAPSIVVAGTKQADTLVGGAGADTITGNKGNDVISGDASGAYVVNLAIAGNLSDADGSETLSYRVASLPAGATLSAGTQNADGSWSLTAANLAGLQVTTTTDDAFELSVTATSTEAGNGASASTTSTIAIDPAAGRNDVIYGNGGDDLIHGNGGNDTLYGGTANDTLFGDNGNDRLYGGKGNDALDGGNGNDILNGNTGNDVVNGGAGDDIVSGDAGDDRVIAGAGNDRYIGGSGFDTLDFSQVVTGVTVNVATGIATGAGNDTFSGFESIIGSAFNDVMTGNAKGNVLVGGAGDDRFQGGAGNDSLTGSAGSDTFVWANDDVFNSAGKRAGLDHVTDFNVGDDVIDLSAILAGRAFATIGDLVHAKDTKDGTVLSVKNATGNGFTDFAVLDGVHGVTTANLATADWLLT